MALSYHAHPGLSISPTLSPSPGCTHLPLTHWRARRCDDTIAQVLQRAARAVEEAVERFRAAGITRYLILALYYDVSCHLAFGKHTGDLDRARVLALCQEGEALCGPMEDREGLVFFRQVREQLE
jgi:hypothetical protein